MPEPTNPQPVEKPKAWYKSKLAKNTGFIFLLIVIIGSIVWYFDLRPYVSTDDARVAEDLIRIAPDGVSGKVLKINVVEGDKVTQGETLAELDHSTYLAELQKAQAHASLADADLKRAEQLYKKGALSKQNLQRAQATGQTAQADLQLAQTALDHTYLKSPVNGVVVEKIAVVGNLFEPAQVAFIVADVDHAWIAANIQETAVGDVKIGQSADISVDEGGKLTGKVSEITVATAAQFALLPAENASGNYIKLVQRVPIKVALDDHPNRVLKDGQSVELKIRVK
jgi:RND family efflux transporter MFP subunit